MQEKAAVAASEAVSPLEADKALTDRARATAVAVRLALHLAACESEAGMPGKCLETLLEARAACLGASPRLSPWQSSIPDSHSLHADVLAAIGGALFRSGQFALSGQCVARAAQRRAKSALLGSIHPMTLCSLANLGVAAAHGGRAADAIVLLRRAGNGLREQLPPSDQRLETVHLNESRLCRAVGGQESEVDGNAGAGQAARVALGVGQRPLSLQARPDREALLTDGLYSAKAGPALF